jgi:hypothetical protein
MFLGFFMVAAAWSPIYGFSWLALPVPLSTIKPVHRREPSCEERGEPEPLVPDPGQQRKRGPARVSRSPGTPRALVSNSTHRNEARSA